jgi:hypothetical protein
MQEEITPHLDCDDGFRRPDTGEEEYVTWEVDNTLQQTIYYLHGALHLFDAGPELQKFTWKNTGVRLTEQVRSALEESKYPLIVSEGTSNEKLARIKHSGYLHRGLASLPRITGSLFVYGASFADNDENILRRVENGNVTRLYVSLFGSPDSKTNKAIVSRVKKMPKNREVHAHRRRPIPLDVFFFDAKSARVWG